MKIIEFILSIFMFIWLSAANISAFRKIDFSEDESTTYGILVAMVLFLLFKIYLNVRDINRKIK